MFTRKERLIQRTGKSGVGRYDFLKLLVVEFNTTKSKSAKEQVLANLANFAYDPINYDYFRNLHIIDLFLYVLSEDDENLIRFAIGGLCNLCIDPINKEYILRNKGVPLIGSLLTSSDEETLLSSISALMFLVTPAHESQIATEELIARMKDFSESSSVRVGNLAKIFLNDYTSRATSNPT